MSFESDSTCIFCKIVAGTEPASKFYEDREILGFMNHKPVHPGECLLIPKSISTTSWISTMSLPHGFIKLGQRLSRKIRAQLNPERVGYVVAGYGVAHAHLIVVPNYHANDITCEHFAVQKEGKIVFADEHIPIAPPEELDRMASLLRIE